MADAHKFDTVSQYSSFNKNETRHPLVNIIDLSKSDSRYRRRLHFGFYTVFWKQVKCGDVDPGKTATEVAYELGFRYP